jgi:hypothetical protein
LPKPESLVKVTTDLALSHHKGGNSPEPTLVTEQPHEHLCLVEVFSHARPIPALVECAPHVNVDVDGQLGRLPGLGKMVEDLERLLQVSNGLPIGAPRHGSQPCLAEIGDRLFPQLAPHSVMCEPLGLLGDAFARELLYSLGDPGMQQTPPVP